MLFTKFYLKFIAAADHSSKTDEIRTTNNERTMPFKPISQYNHSEEHGSSIRLFFKTNSALSISYNVADNVYTDFSSKNTQEQTSGSTLSVLSRRENVLSNLTNPIYVYIIPVIGIFIIIIVLSCILFILHRKTGMHSNTISTQPMHFKMVDNEFERDRLSTNATNQTDTHNCPYEIINVDSDDSGSITCLKIDTPVETSNQQNKSSPSSISRSYETIDSDGYQCPLSCETIEKTTSMDTHINNYLTVVQNV